MSKSLHQFARRVNLARVVVLRDLDAAWEPLRLGSARRASGHSAPRGRSFFCGSAALSAQREHDSQARRTEAVANGYAVHNGRKSRKHRRRARAAAHNNKRGDRR